MTIHRYSYISSRGYHVSEVACTFVPVLRLESIAYMGPALRPGTADETDVPASVAGTGNLLTRTPHLYPSDCMRWT